MTSASDKTVVLITGASSGIGLETVRALAKLSPAYHILLGSRSLDKGQKALTEIQSTTDNLQGTISLLQLEVTDEKSILAAKDHVESTYGKLDILINNAGIIDTRQDVPTIDILRNTFETNTFSAAIITEIFEPLLKKSPKPKLIHVSSGQGSMTLKLDPTSKWSYLRGDPYRMSKAAMNMLAACHKVNFEEWGCKVYAYDPGFCLTNLTGEEGMKMRVQLGARPATDPADGLVDIIANDKPSIDMEGMLEVDGGKHPW